MCNIYIYIYIYVEGEDKCEIPVGLTTKFRGRQKPADNI